MSNLKISTVTIRPVGVGFDEPVTLFRGDFARYTGKSQQLHGATFYEIELVEGHLKGQTRVTMRAPVSK